MKKISLSEAFAILESCAASGARCPIAGTNGLTSDLTGKLAREGKIRIDIYPHNYRVITILNGLQRGKTTAPPSNPKWKPYLTIDAGLPKHNTRNRKIAP